MARIIDIHIEDIDDIQLEIVEDQIIAALEMLELRYTIGVSPEVEDGEETEAVEEMPD